MRQTTSNYNYGNFLDAKVDVFAHQTNCKGVMGSGVAKQIRDKYPEVYPKYQEACQKEHMLGKCQLVQTYKGPMVANLFGQDSYGSDGKQYTDYIALRSALNSLADQMLECQLSTVAFPHNMGCCRGGGDWDKVAGIINEAFRGKPIRLEIWTLDATFSGNSPYDDIVPF